jgi:hypothetical protein
MLPWLTPNCFGFGSFSNSGTAPAANPINCADSPDSVLKDMIGSTCAELKHMGKCDSSDELVASLMAKHCAASCTDCIPSRMTYTGGANGGTMMCKEIEDGCDGPPIQCPVLEELAPAADFGLGDECEPAAECTVDAATDANDYTPNSVVASDYTANSVVASDYTANSDVMADVDSVSYASGFAAGEGVTGDNRLAWAECCVRAAYMINWSSSGPSEDYDADLLATNLACVEHSSNTGSCVDYENAGQIGIWTPHECCGSDTRDWDPMCVFDYCLNKLSPLCVPQYLGGPCR